MTAFFRLFMDASSRPGLNNDPEWADRHLPGLVAEGPLRMWRPGMIVSDKGTRLLIGAATWSGYDMRLLDLIAEAKRADPQEASIVDVFNTADCRQMSDFRDYIPTLPEVFQTPVVGVWQDGRLQEAQQGYAARDLIARLFGSTSQQITQQVEDWIKAPTSAAS
jgi:hypothetical protein